MPFPKIYLSHETLKSLNDEKERVTRKWTQQFKLQPALVKAIIDKESMDYPLAYRVDRSVLKKQAWYRKTITTAQKQLDECWASYGYMQVLYGLARHYGYTGIPFGLFEPNLSIKYGCRHLDYLKKRYKGRILDMIHAYNWGSNAWMDFDNDGIKDPGEPYKNQDYVDDVYKLFKEYGGKL